jgi:hypothetical protein
VKPPGRFLLARAEKRFLRTGKSGLSAPQDMPVETCNPC